MQRKQTVKAVDAWCARRKGTPEIFCDNGNDNIEGVFYDYNFQGRRRKIENSELQFGKAELE